MKKKVTRPKSVAKRSVHRNSTPKPGTTPVDRRLLARAERETMGLPEGVVPPVPGEIVRVIGAGEFDSVCAQLKELVHTVIDCWECGADVGGIEPILVGLHATRLNLESAARQEVRP